MIIRILTAHDAASFQALRLRGLIECPDAFASSYEEEVDTAIGEVAKRLEANPDKAVFGSFVEENLDGVIGLRREGMQKLRHKAQIWGMYVAPEVRRGGHGRALMQCAMENARRMSGVEQVNLGVNARNEAARALYEGLGFTSFGIEKGSLKIGEVAHDEHHMVWRVTGRGG